MSQSTKDGIVTISNIQIAALNSLISNLEKFETTYTDGLYNSMSTVIEKLDLESENFQEYINTLKEYIKKIKEAIEQQKKEFIKDGLIIGGGVIIGAVIIGTTILSGGTALPITLASILGIATIGATCIPLGLDIKELKEFSKRMKRLFLNFNSILTSLIPVLFVVSNLIGLKYSSFNEIIFSLYLSHRR